MSHLGLLQKEIVMDSVRADTLLVMSYNHMHLRMIPDTKEHASTDAAAYATAALHALCTN